MNRRQNPELLSMVGLGTLGGQRRADGSQMERGIHLRWQMGHDLGFPSGGFDLYRRKQNLDFVGRCAYAVETPVGTIAWVPKDPGYAPLPVETTPSGKIRPAEGCGLTTGILLLGEQELRLEFNAPARCVQFTLDGSTPPVPAATAFWRSPGGEVQVISDVALQGPDGEWIIRLFADRIDSVVLSGTDMLLCEMCAVLVDDGYDLDWGQLPVNNPYPIYLPITHPDWGSPHAHSPDDQAEAEARLPANLPAGQREKYAEGFSRDLHGILYDLAGTKPQVLYQVDEQDSGSQAAITWPGLHLLKLVALDPNLARILGLYWHDQPPDPDLYYDYRLVAHYDLSRFPGRRFNYARLQPGTRCGTLLEHEGIFYATANPIQVEKAGWGGVEMNALVVAPEISAAPLSIRLPEGARSVSLLVSLTDDLDAHGFSGNRLAVKKSASAGERTIDLEDSGGIDTVLLMTGGELQVFEIVLRSTTEPLGDVIYTTFHHRIQPLPELAAPVLEPPRAGPARTGLSAEGGLAVHQSSVGLRWSLPDTGQNYLEPGAPIFYHLRRAGLGDGAAPGAPGENVLLNADSPTLVTASFTPSGSSLDHDQSYFTDRSLVDGWYAYQVRGIDLFGRLGAWSQSQNVHVQDQVPPPPPQNVTAEYLDPSDPRLAPADREWVDANGPGLRAGWEWPGLLRLQAPDVAPELAEFRIYSVPGELNMLSGEVRAVMPGEGISDLATDLDWQGAPDALAGEFIRAGTNFFEVTANSQGPDCTIRVNNLAAPAAIPEPGAFSLVFSRGRSYWSDYRQPANWKRRLHAEPAAAIPIVRGRVQSVEDYHPDPNAPLAQPGATRTVMTGESLDDQTGVLLPGALLCGGVVYHAYGHALGAALAIYITPQPVAGDASQLVEPVPGDAFTYFPGYRYQVYISGFELLVDPAKGTAAAYLAVSCSDGRPYVEDDPVWTRPGRGGLGSRPGNEGSLSNACKVVAVKRSLPASPGNIPAAGEPIYARPANYYGQAKYTLAWEPAVEAAGYALYRCSGAALFDQDRQQRQTRKDYYAPIIGTGHDPFEDDPGFAAWLAEFDPSLSAADLLADPDSHLDAWRAWAKRFYSALDDAEAQALANRAGNEKAFRRVNKDPIQTTAYLDSFDGRGRGIYIYRLRSIDAAGNFSPLSEAYPPVHIYDVTPPTTPVVTSVRGGEKLVVLTWQANREADLQEYRIWRASQAEALKDVRRLVPTATVLPDSQPAMTYVDQDLDGLQTYYYRLAAVDANGNLSAPTPLLAARAADSLPPAPPLWERYEWVRLDATGAAYAFDDPAAQGFPPAVALTWLAAERLAQATVERRSRYEKVWAALATLSEPLDASDPHAEDARRFVFYDQSASPTLQYSYRIRACDQAGNLNTQAFNEIIVAPALAAAHSPNGGTNG